MTYRTLSPVVRNTRGLRIATEIFVPDGHGKFPFVLIFHGFTGYKEGTDLTDLAARLAGVGIASVRFTTVGFGDSDGSLESDYRFSQFGKDAETVMSHVVTREWADPARIGIYGHSMGGRSAVLFAAKHPKVRAICAFSAPVSFVGTRYGQIAAEWKKQGFMEKVSGRDGKTIRVPYAYFTDEQDARHDTLGAARLIKLPHAFVLAGSMDTDVPWQETKRVFDALNCPKEWKLFSGIDHYYKRNPETLPWVHGPIVGFFSKWL